MMSVDNAGLIARDRGLPGLAQVLDPEMARQQMQLGGIIDPHDRVMLEYIRYKPQRRALALLKVATSDGQARSIVVRACDSSGWHKFLTTDQANSVQRQGGLVCGDLQCSFEAFPYERRLRHIAKLYDPQRSNKILQRITGVVRVADEPWKMRALAYKPARRFVVQACSASSTVVIKFYTHEDFSDAYERAALIAQTPLQRFSPALIHHSERYDAIAIQWIDGATLSDLLALNDPQVCALLAAGQLLADWHLAASEGTSSLDMRHHGFNSLSLRNLADDVAWLIPNMRNQLDNLLDSLASHTSQLQASDDLIHGDFYAKQIIVQNSGMRLIDFDELGRGHRYQDIATFVGQLYWNAVRDEAQLVYLDERIEAFLTGYEERTGGWDKHLLHASIAIGILRCLPHPFRRGLPNWADKMDQMLQWASQWCGRIGQGDHTQSTLCAEQLTHAPLAHEDEESRPFLDAQQVDPQIRAALGMPQRDWRTQPLVHTRLLRHKPGRRLLVEYSFYQHAGDCARTVLGKSRIGKPVNRYLLRLHDELQSLKRAGVFVPRVLGEVKGLNLWLQEKMTGSPVSAESAPAVHWAVGQALAELHGSAITVNRCHGIDEELETLQAQYQRWLPDGCAWSADSHTVLGLCKQLSKELPRSPSVLLHRDLYFEQVLHSAEGISLIDFDLAAMGPAELDIGNYVGHLDEVAIRHPELREHCSVCSQQFIAGYLARRGDVSLPAIDRWRFLSLARLAAISQRISVRQRWTGEILRHWIAAHCHRSS